MGRFEALVDAKRLPAGIVPDWLRVRQLAVAAFTVPPSVRHREHTFLYKDSTMDRPACASIEGLRGRYWHVLAIGGTRECAADVTSQRYSALQ